MPAGAGPAKVAMSALYWFALVVGVGMYLFSLAADFCGHADGIDTSGDVDLHAGDGHIHTHHGEAGYQILSLRNVTYFLFAFGVSGVMLTWVWDGRRGLVTAFLATLLGLVGGAIATVLFGWVRKTESGHMPDDRGWAGLTGVVTLPIQAGGTGKIEVVRGGREHELLARPFEPDAANPEQWRTVMIIEMRHGIAHVAPNDPALEAPDTLRIAPRLES